MFPWITWPESKTELQRSVRLNCLKKSKMWAVIHGDAPSAITQGGKPIESKANRRQITVFYYVCVHKRGIQWTSVLESRAGRGPTVPLHPGSGLLPEA